MLCGGALFPIPVPAVGCHGLEPAGLVQRGRLRAGEGHRLIGPPSLHPAKGLEDDGSLCTSSGIGGLHRVEFAGPILNVDPAYEMSGVRAVFQNGNQVKVRIVGPVL